MTERSSDSVGSSGQHPGLMPRLCRVRASSQPAKAEGPRRMGRSLDSLGELLNQVPFIAIMILAIPSTIL